MTRRLALLAALAACGDDGPPPPRREPDLAEVDRRLRAVERAIVPDDTERECIALLRSMWDSIQDVFARLDIEPRSDIERRYQEHPGFLGACKALPAAARRCLKQFAHARPATAISTTA